MVVSLWVVWSCWCRSRAGALTRPLGRPGPWMPAAAPPEVPAPALAPGISAPSGSAARSPPPAPLVTNPPAVGGERQPFGPQELSCQFLLGRLICLGCRRTSAAELADQRHRQNGDDERGQIVRWRMRASSPRGTNSANSHVHRRKASPTFLPNPYLAVNNARFIGNPSIL